MKAHDATCIISCLYRGCLLHTDPGQEGRGANLLPEPSPSNSCDAVGQFLAFWTPFHLRLESLTTHTHLAAHRLHRGFTQPGKTGFDPLLSCLMIPACNSIGPYTHNRPIRPALYSRSVLQQVCCSSHPANRFLPSCTLANV